MFKRNDDIFSMNYFIENISLHRDVLLNLIIEQSKTLQNYVTFQ